MNLTGKVCLVTGGARGIGRAIVETYAAAGARAVFAFDRAFDGFEEVTAKHASVTPVVLDVTDGAACARVVLAAHDRFGRLDILVNNAGVVRLAPAEALTDEDWDLTMNVNLRAPFVMARAAFEALRDSGSGRVVNISSQAAVVGIDAHVAYCASKAGIVGMTKVLAIEWARHGITCNTVGPTVVLTELGKQAWAGEKGEAMKAKIPVGRFAQPEEVAASVVFLASEAAAMINGHTLIIDGGFVVQ